MDINDRKTGCNPRNNIALNAIHSQQDWQRIFRRYDHDNDDKIPIREFILELQDATDGNIPILVIENALKEADRNGDNIITLEEFLKLVQRSVQGRSKYGSEFLNNYIKRTIPRRISNRQLVQYATSTTDGEYEESYKFWPPPLAMICISILEIATFVYDTSLQGYGHYNGPLAKFLIYNPYRRKEVWRYLTYMFIHAGAQHLVVNLLVQIMLGIPLEMVHGWWRVTIIYISGVLAGSLGTSVCDPKVYLLGASGGVYSLITAHLATVVMNWSEMTFAIWQLIVIGSLCIGDTSVSIYNRYILDTNRQIGYEAHFAGALAGLLVGIYLLKNLEIKSWENKIWWIAVIVYTLLMSVGIAVNLIFPEYFPMQA